MPAQGVFPQLPHLPHRLDNVTDGILHIVQLFHNALELVQQEQLLTVSVVDLQAAQVAELSVGLAAEQPVDPFSQASCLDYNTVDVCHVPSLLET